MQSNLLRTALVALAVAAIWGYFADLPDNEIGWFVGRLFVTPLIAVAVLHWPRRRAKSAVEAS
jgi:hypothetical protein